MNNKIKLLIVILLIPAMLFAVNSDALYEQGVEAFNSGNYGNSELIFRKVVSSSDDYEIKDKAWFYLAKSIYQQKKYKGALLEFNRFLNSCRTPGLAIESRYWIAESNFQLGEQVRAIEEYKRFISQSRDKGMLTLAHDRIASIYFIQKRYDEAVLEWETAITLSADTGRNAQWIFLIGKSHFENKKYDDAMKRLSPLLTSKADVKTIAQARMIIARIHQAAGGHRQALLILNGIPDTMLKEYPYLDAQYLKARSNIELGNTAAAKNMLALFLLIGRDSEWYQDALYESALITLNTGDREKAIDTLETVRKNTKKTELKSKAAKELSKIFIKSDPARSIPYLEDSLNTTESNDENREAMLLLGRAYINMGDNDKAAAIYLKFAEKYPFDASLDEAYFAIGKIYYYKAKYDLAAENFHKLKQNHPFSKHLNEIDYYEGMIYFNSQDYKNASDRIKKYLMKRNIENRYDAQVVLLNSYIALDDKNNSFKTANIILNSHLNEKDADKVLFDFCEFYIKNGNKPDRFYDKIVQKYPDGRWALKIYLYYADTAFEAKNFRRAADYYIKHASHKEAESRGYAYYSAIVSLFTLKDYNRIISLSEDGEIPPMDSEQTLKASGLTARANRIKENYSKAYVILLFDDIRLHDDEVKFALIESAAAIGDIETSEKIIPLIKDDSIMYGNSCLAVAKAYRVKKNFAAAEKNLKIVSEEISGHPQAETAKLMLSEILLEQNNFTAAFEAAQKITGRDKIGEAEAVMIIALYGSGRKKEAQDLSKKSIRAILRTGFAERVILLNTDYAYAEDDSRSFAFFAGYLKAYKTYSDYTAYHSAMLDISNGYHQRALPVFMKLAANENIYTLNSLEKCAEINLFYRKNKILAEKYYKAMLAVNGVDRNSSEKALINLALIYYETGRIEESEKILSELKNNGAMGQTLIQYENISELITSGKK